MSIYDKHIASRKNCNKYLNTTIYLHNPFFIGGWATNEMVFFLNDSSCSFKVGKFFFYRIYITYKYLWRAYYRIIWKIPALPSLFMIHFTDFKGAGVCKSFVHKLHTTLCAHRLDIYIKKVSAVDLCHFFAKQSV